MSTSLDQLRVDIVGSFLRPPELKRAAAAFAELRKVALKLLILVIALALVRASV